MYLIDSGPEYHKDEGSRTRTSFKNKLAVMLPPARLPVFTKSAIGLFNCSLYLDSKRKPFRQRFGRGEDTVIGIRVLNRSRKQEVNAKVNIQPLQKLGLGKLTVAPA